MSEGYITCRKCGGEIGEGVVFAPIGLSGAPDLGGGIGQTMTLGSSTNLVPCWKCKSCGHTFTGEPEPAKEVKEDDPDTGGIYITGKNPPAGPVIYGNRITERIEDE